MRLRIVYIDDEVDLCELFSDILSNGNREITTYTDVAKALESIQGSMPDIVFLDFRLVDTSGDSVASELPSDLPKVLITGEIDVQVVNSFVKIFPKPVPWQEIDQFLQSIERKAA